MQSTPSTANYLLGNSPTCLCGAECASCTALRQRTDEYENLARAHAAVAAAAREQRADAVAQRSVLKKRVAHVTRAWNAWRRAVRWLKYRNPLVVALTVRQCAKMRRWSWSTWLACYIRSKWRRKVCSTLLTKRRHQALISTFARWRLVRLHKRANRNALKQRRQRASLFSITRLFCSWRAFSRVRVSNMALMKTALPFVRSRWRATSAVWRWWRTAAARNARRRVLVSTARAKCGRAAASAALRAWVGRLIVRKTERAARLRFELRRSLRVWHAACRRQSLRRHRSLTCALLALLQRHEVLSGCFAVWASALRVRKVTQ